MACRTQLNIQKEKKINGEIVRIRKTIEFCNFMQLCAFSMSLECVSRDTLTQHQQQQRQRQRQQEYKNTQELTCIQQANMRLVERSGTKKEKTDGTHNGIETWKSNKRAVRCKCCNVRAVQKKLVFDFNYETIIFISFVRENLQIMRYRLGVANMRSECYRTREWFESQRKECRAVCLCGHALKHEPFNQTTIGIRLQDLVRSARRNSSDSVEFDRSSRNRAFFDTSQ